MPTSINHHHLLIFWTFAKTESFTKTATALRIAQSAVTTQIRNLEDSLDLTLINRSNLRRPELTEEGKRVAEFADSIFELSAELANWARKTESNSQSLIRMGALSGLSRNLQYAFMEPYIKNPKIAFDVTTGDQKKLIDLVLSHDLDVVLTSHNVLSDHTNRALQTHVLTSSPVVFVAQRNIKRKGDLKEVIASSRLFVPGRNFEARPELDAFLKRVSSQVKIAGEIDDIALLRILALRSECIVAVPEMGVKNDLTKRDLVVVGKARGIEQRFYAITRDKLKPDDKIQFLIDQIKKN